MRRKSVGQSLFSLLPTRSRAKKMRERPSTLSFEALNMSKFEVDERNCGCNAIDLLLPDLPKKRDNPTPTPDPPTNQISKSLSDLENREAGNAEEAVGGKDIMHHKNILNWCCTYVTKPPTKSTKMRQ